MPQTPERLGPARQQEPADRGGSTSPPDLRQAYSNHYLNGGHATGRKHKNPLAVGVGIVIAAIGYIALYKYGHSTKFDPAVEQGSLIVVFAAIVSLCWLRYRHTHQEVNMSEPTTTSEIVHIDDDALELNEHDLPGLD